MPQVHVKLPNGREYTLDDPSGSLSDAQAYQLALAQDPDARAAIAQNKAQAKADSPWLSALRGAPEVMSHFRRFSSDFSSSRIPRGGRSVKGRVGVVTRRGGRGPGCGLGATASGSRNRLRASQGYVDVLPG